MKNAPQVFNFDSLSVRVQLDDIGQPWFNANDICAALELSNPHKAVADHVDPDDLTKRDTIDALGRTQSANHVNESGLYSLIFGSTKESAKRFKRWVTAEVLPSLHKSGTYTVAQPSQAPTIQCKATETTAVLMMVHDFLIKNVPGINPGIAAAATLDSIKQNTGVDMEPIRRALPAAVEPPKSLNATQLGKEAGMSGRAVNKALADMGFQVKNDRKEWELTPEGANWGEAIPYSRNGHSGYQLLWNPATLDLLQQKKSA
jgi:prophage antirepressor-like protein